MPERPKAKTTKRPAGVTAKHADAKKRRRGQPRDRTKVAPPVYLEPWEKQPGESIERYEAFLVYRDQLTNGALRRGLERAAHACGKHPSMLEQWSREDHWRERVGAWDRHLQSVKDAAKIRAIEAIAEREAMQLQAAAQTLQAPLQALLTNIAEFQSRGENYLGGLTPWQLTRLSLVAARAMPSVIQGERLVQGLSTANVDAHVSGDVSVRDARAAAEAMTPIDRERYLLGEGFSDGRDTDRRDAAQRSQDRAGRR